MGKHRQYELTEQQLTEMGVKQGFFNQRQVNAAQDAYNQSRVMSAALEAGKQELTEGDLAAILGEKAKWVNPGTAIGFLGGGGPLGAVAGSMIYKGCKNSRLNREEQKLQAEFDVMHMQTDDLGNLQSPQFPDPERSKAHVQDNPSWVR